MKDLYSGFIANNNYRLVSIDIDESICTMEGTITETSSNPFGIVHGGYIFGLADTAAGILANSLLEDCVTMNSTIDFLRPIRCEKVICEAKCIKKGRLISVFDVYIYDENRKALVHSNITYCKINK